MTYVVDQMAKKGLVTRKLCENDRRVTYVEIQTKGIKLMEEIFPYHEQRIAELFSALSNEEILVMTKNMKKVSKSISNGGKYNVKIY